MKVTIEIHDTITKSCALGGLLIRTWEVWKYGHTLYSKVQFHCKSDGVKRGSKFQCSRPTSWSLYVHKSLYKH